MTNTSFPVYWHDENEQWHKIETNVQQATDIKNHFAVSLDSERQSLRKTLSNQQKSINEKIRDAN